MTDQPTNRRTKRGVESLSTQLKTSFTVCFFSFVIFYDDVILKVVELIDFRKKFLKGMVDAFYVI